MCLTPMSLDRTILNLRWLFLGLLLLAVGLGSWLNDVPQIILVAALITLAVALTYALSLEILSRTNKSVALLPLLSNWGDILLITWTVYYFDEAFVAFYYMVIVVNALYCKQHRDRMVSVVVISLLYGVIFWQSASPENAIPLHPLLYIITFFVVSYLVGYTIELRKSEQQQLANLYQEEERRSKLLSTLAHELHTPLTMIKGAVDLLLDGRPGVVNNTQMNFLQTISQNCERLITLVEDLLAQAKAEAGWVEIRAETLDFRKPIKKTVQDVRHMLAQKKQVIQLDYPQILSKVMADEVWIQQVMINLLHNASKYTSEGGKIFVSISENQQSVLVSVTDDGAGMSPAEREHLFEPFFRGDHHQQGTGLGLTIVKGIIEKHGGKLYVDTTLGRGTTFLFALPKEV